MLMSSVSLRALVMIHGIEPTMQEIIIRSIEQMFSKYSMTKKIDVK